MSAIQQPTLPVTRVSHDGVVQALTSRVATQTDVASVLSATAETVAGHLGVSCVAYGEVSPELDWVDFPVEWSDGRVSVQGRHRFHPESWFAREYLSGRTLTVSDVRALDYVRDEAEQMADSGTAAFVAVPLLKDGVLTALFSAISSTPRQWSQDEVRFLTEVAAGTWRALDVLRASSKLRRSEEEFRSMAETFPALCWLCDLDGNAYWGNTAFTRYFGVGDRSRDEMIEVVHPDDRGAIVSLWPGRSRDDLPAEAMVRLRDGRGEIRHFLSRVAPVLDPRGLPIRWCGVMVDLTETKAQERRQNVLRSFSDASRDVGDAGGILSLLQRITADQLSATGVAYAHITDQVGLAGKVVHARTGGGGATGLDQVFDLSLPGFDAVASRYRRGKSVVINDADHPQEELTEEVRASTRGARARAAINVPVCQEGRLVALFSVYDGSPRNWSADDVVLCEELADRAWQAIARIRSEEALRERDRHQAFLISWTDRVRAETSSQSILDLTLDLLGAYLGLRWLNYVEVSADERHFTVTAQYTRSDVSTVGRTFPVEAIGRAVFTQLYARQFVRIDDTANHPLIPVAARPHYSAIQVAAFMGVPLTRHDAIPAVLVAQQEKPRRWTDGEEQLLRDVADRLWSIIERARIEERLRESEGLLTAFMMNAPVGMHLKDAAGAFIRINPELANLFGGSMDDVLERSIHDLLDTEAAFEISRIDASARVGRAESVELTLGEGAEPRSLLTIAFPVAATGSEAARTGGFTIDVTARKRAEAALERSREALFQAEKLSALGSLLAGVSHELNNPLSIVVAQSVMMERKARGGELAERAQKIRKAADRCARIVQTFLAMARQKRPEREPVDLNAVVNAALELTEYGLRNDRIKVERDLAETMPLISADSDQLHQIIVNLLVNAQQAVVEAKVAQPCLTLRTRLAGRSGAVFLEVADNGPGVPEAVRRRVFEPFFTTKPQGRGTGMGLSFSQGLAEAHGGRLELVTSQVGACFRLTLPVDENQVVGPAPVELDPPLGALTKRALVVDDEVEIAEALADFLSLEGYGSEIAVGGVAARNRLASGAAFDLIVSDLRMPDMDGPQLHAWVTHARPELVPVMAFATGDTLGAAAAGFLKTIEQPVLEKPFTPEAVRRFLDRMKQA